MILPSKDVRRSGSYLKQNNGNNRYLTHSIPKSFNLMKLFLIGKLSEYFCPLPTNCCGTLASTDMEEVIGTGS